MAKIAYTYGTLETIRGFARNKEDGLYYELFEITREPIKENVRFFFNLLSCEEIVGYKQDESQLRLMALEKMKECLSSEFHETYSDYNMTEYRRGLDSFTERVIWANDYWKS